MTIGFIGLGNMGQGMARNLLTAHTNLMVYDQNSEAVAALVELGAKAASFNDLSECEVILTMLPAGPQVADVLGQLADSPPKLLIDCSTIAVTEARALQTEMAAKGHRFVDAPVSGGVAAAATGSLTFMVGAERELFEEVEAVLGPMANNIFSAGGPGNGQAAKISNNMLLGISMLGTCEAFHLAEKLGLDAQTFFDISSKASGQCWSMTSYCPAPGPLPSAPSNKEYEPGFSAAMMLKDLGLALQAAGEATATTEMGRAAYKHYQILNDLGYGGRDFSVPFDLLRREKPYATVLKSPDLADNQNA